MFFALAVAHALADFPLQGAYLARQKIRTTADGTSEWIVALSAHALIHAGGVWLISGSKLLGAIEFIAHGRIDLAKGKGKFGLLTDQALHLACKAAYAVALCHA